MIEEARSREPAAFGKILNRKAIVASLTNDPNGFFKELRPPRIWIIPRNQPASNISTY